MEDNDLCICGHAAEDHHRSWFPNGYLLIEECEYYGANEAGGAICDEVTGRWEDHCFHFKLDKEANHGTTRESTERKAGC